MLTIREFGNKLYENATSIFTGAAAISAIGCAAALKTNRSDLLRPDLFTIALASLTTFFASLAGTASVRPLGARVSLIAAATVAPAAAACARSAAALNFLLKKFS